MTDARLQELRRLLRTGQLEPDLVAELKDVARRLVRLRLLPPSYAPYGRWDDEAADEVFASWYERRLLGRGHLQLLLDRAATAGGFRRLAEESLRQHLLSERDRSQGQNIYRRLVALLAADADFVLVRDARRPQDRWWRVADEDVSEWAGDDRALVAAAWALGDFVLIRYRADASKLAPLLAADELKRFVLGLLERVEAALTPTLIMRAVSARFDLGAVEVGELGEAAEESRGGPDVAAEVALRETAWAIVAELSARQVEVLKRTGEESIEETARALGCSVGTVVNEQRRVGAVITRFAEDEAERDNLLKVVGDLVYSDSDE